MTFLDMLGDAARHNRSMLCVGLDPEPTRFPARYKGDANRIYDFCAAIVDATADLVNWHSRCSAQPSPNGRVRRPRR